MAETSLRSLPKDSLTWPNGDAGKAQIVRITIDQLASLISALADREGGYDRGRLLKGIRPLAPVTRTFAGVFDTLELTPNRFRWGVGFNVSSGGPIQVYFGDKGQGSKVGFQVSSTSGLNFFQYDELGGVLLGNINVAAAVGAVYGYQELQAPEALA